MSRMRKTHVRFCESKEDEVAPHLLATRLDLHMPVMNGYESAKIIRGLDKRVPIVAMTADVVLGVKEKCREHGMNHFISKPFDPDDFIRQIKGFLDGSQAESGAEPLLDIESGLKNMGGTNCFIWRC